LSWDDTRTSKFLSLILRHKPDTVGIKLDRNGWADVSGLIAACNQHDCPLSRDTLERIVQENSKKRFHFNEDRTKIRAAQGHSTEVDLGYKNCEPPDILYHGTAGRFLESIRQAGLQKQARHHVHLTENIDTASSVGKRYGKLALLSVNARQMHLDGHLFFLSENGVWLTDSVPTVYISFPI
jgi:putative RNA 2'-phosphotransferase